MDSRIVERLSEEEWSELRKLPLSISQHAWKRFDDEQRDLFDERCLRDLIGRRPLLVGRQANGRISLFARQGKSIYRIILAERMDLLEVVTFLRTKKVPGR